MGPYHIVGRSNAQTNGSTFRMCRWDRRSRSYKHRMVMRVPAKFCKWVVSYPEICPKALSIEQEYDILGVVHHVQIACQDRSISATKYHRSCLWLLSLRMQNPEKIVVSFEQYHNPRIISRNIDDIVAGIVLVERTLPTQVESLRCAFWKARLKVSLACVLGRSRKRFSKVFIHPYPKQYPKHLASKRKTISS